MVGAGWVCGRVVPGPGVAISARPGDAARPSKVPGPLPRSPPAAAACAACALEWARAGVGGAALMADESGGGARAAAAPAAATIAAAGAARAARARTSALQVARAGAAHDRVPMDHAARAYR